MVALLWAVTLRTEEAPVPGHTQFPAPREPLLPSPLLAAANMETTGQKLGKTATVQPGHKPAGQGGEKGLEWESCPESFPWG